MHITLEQIRAKSPCREGWTRLLKSLGNPSDLSMEVSFGDIAKSNGAQDALWCLRCVDDRRFCVSMVLPAVKRASKHTTDKRVNDCIAAIEQWLSGDGAVDLRAARAAANAAYAAARAAADAAVAAAAANAAYAAANAAAYAAYAAYAAANAAADAAYAAAAAEAAAYAAYAAEAAAYAAYAADAAAAAERQLQIADIIAVSPLHALKGDHDA